MRSRNKNIVSCRRYCQCSHTFRCIKSLSKQTIRTISQNLRTVVTCDAVDSSSLQLWSGNTCLLSSNTLPRPNRTISRPPTPLTGYHTLQYCCVGLRFCATVFSMVFSIHFYPRDAMLARVIEIATCLSVRPSVTRRYCVKTKNASGMISSPSGSPKTLVFPTPNFITKF